MLLVNSRKTSLQIRASFRPKDNLPFSIQGTFFSQSLRSEAMAKKVFYAAGLLIKSVLLYCTAAQQWEAMGQPEVSKFGMMLQRHIFKRIAGAGLSDACGNAILTSDVKVSTTSLRKTFVS